MDEIYQGRPNSLTFPRVGELSQTLWTKQNQLGGVVLGRDLGPTENESNWLAAKSAASPSLMQAAAAGRSIITVLPHLLNAILRVEVQNWSNASSLCRLTVMPGSRLNGVASAAKAKAWASGSPEYRQAVE